MEEYNYEELLKRARERMPKVVFSSKKRFEMPKASILIQGNKTIITNINNIANYLNRDVKHLVKFLAKELAASFTLEKGKAIFIGIYSTSAVNKKIELYVNEYVKCRECNSYDTELIKEDRIYYLHCLACGAKYPVKQIK